MTRFVIIGALLAAAPLALADTFSFSAGESAEMSAELEMSSPGADWAVAGKEAAVAAVTLDGRLEQHVVLYAGASRYSYRVFLGQVLPGDHTVRVERSARYSARGAGLTVHKASFQSFTPSDPYYDVMAHAPVLFARQNTIGRFSDVPMISYCERIDGYLQYTVIFSNEDGGTSTRALMARWGRTTDIEYIYRIPRAGGAELIQGRNHKEVPFEGKRFGTHPMLIPVTDNNMVSGEAASALRFQIAPVLIDLAGHSREQVMDKNPIAYQVMAKELAREGKIRRFGIAAGESISDPRNYLYLEYRAANINAALAVSVRIKSDRTGRSSDLGRADYAISRDGWVRTTVELPPGTRPDALWEISFDCRVALPSERNEPLPHSGTCELQQVGNMFLLDANYRPGPNLWKGPGEGKLRTGESAVFIGW